MYSIFKYVFILGILVANEIVLVSASKFVKLVSNGPIVQGGTISFEAIAYEGHDPAKGTFSYIWIDNAIPSHERKIQKTDAHDSWSVTYANTYPIGIYEVQVVIKTCLFEFICYEFGSERLEFEITETLNGEIKIIQGNETRMTNYVSSIGTTTQEIILHKTDADFIKNATTVLTYWFVDCTYYGITEDLKFKFNFTKPGEEHTIEALVTADFTPLPPTTTVAPSTTTHKPNVTTTKPTTTKPTTTTSKPTTSTTKATSTPTKNSIETNMTNLTLRNHTKRSTDVPQNITNVVQKVNGTLIPSNVNFPYVCNGTKIAKDLKLSYGYFYRKIIVEAPLLKVNVTGNNWLQQGAILRLNVKCQATQNMQFCINYYEGTHNVTKNETCYEYRNLTSCDFPIERYYTKTHTVVIVIKNDISKVVTPVTVTIYKVQTQAQLSVIVVPVAFSLVAVVLIVFGVAYYIQNRSRFVVEVADFNFGQQYSDMEYKTFRERLRDSLSDAFTRDSSPNTSEPPVWPPGRKYGSMT